jgi:hypothetical protein
VKHADGLVPLGNEEAVLQGKTEKLTLLGRHYGMEMSEDNTKVVRI